MFEYITLIIFATLIGTDTTVKIA